MHALQNTMPNAIHFGNSFCGRSTPRQKDYTSSLLLDDSVNDFLRKFLPSFARMAVRLVCPHRQTRIQKQDSSVRPRCEETTTVRWRSERVRVLDFEELVDILEGGWRGRWGPN